MLSSTKTARSAHFESPVPKVMLRPKRTFKLLLLSVLKYVIHSQRKEIHLQFRDDEVSVCTAHDTSFVINGKKKRSEKKKNISKVVLERNRSLTSSFTQD